VTSTDQDYIDEFGQGLHFYSSGDNSHGHIEWSDGNGWVDDFGWENVGWDWSDGWSTRWGFWGSDHDWHPFAHDVPRVDVTILRPDEDVVYLVESDGSTLVAQGDPTGDTYTIRLTAQPDWGETITVELQPDGQLIASDACGCDPRFAPATSHKG